MLILLILLDRLQFAFRCSHVLLWQALYVEITVVESDDARLYKALVRWLTERGSHSVEVF